MVNRDCIMANLEQRDCKGLKNCIVPRRISLARSISRLINTIEMAAERMVMRSRSKTERIER